MSRHMFFLLLSCAALMAQAGQPEFAAGQTDKNGVVQKAVAADTPEKFAAQTQRVLEDMQTGGRYEYINASDKHTVERLLEQMAAALQGAGSVEAMNSTQRIQLFNLQEEINGLLKHNDSNRLVCESRAPIGSNILRTTCHTHGQIEATARNTQQGLQEFDHSRLCNSGSMETPCAPGINRPTARGGR
jgi:hypothetical protein